MTGHDDVAIEDWSLIFLPFFSEHVCLFPDDDPGLAKYMELILHMA